MNTEMNKMKEMIEKDWEQYFENAREAMAKFDVRLESHSVADNRELTVYPHVIAIVKIKPESIPLPEGTVVIARNSEKIYYASGTSDKNVQNFQDINPKYGSHYEPLVRVGLLPAVFTVLEFPGIREEVLKLAFHYLKSRYIPQRSYEAMERSLSEIKSKYNNKYPDLAINWEMLKGLKP